MSKNKSEVASSRLATSENRPGDFGNYPSYCPHLSAALRNCQRGLDVALLSTGGAL